MSKYYDRYMPIEVMSKKASGDEATANKVIFTLPYACQGAIAQVRQDADNEVDPTGLEIEMKEDDGVHTCEVSVTGLAENDIVSLLAFK